MASHDDRRVFDALENGLSYTDSATARHQKDWPPFILNTSLPAFLTQHKDELLQ